jgi:hypothetical protein
MVNTKNKTMNSMILMRIETFIMGNNPVYLRPNVASTLSEKKQMRTVLIANFVDLGRLIRVKPIADLDGGRTPRLSAASTERGEATQASNVSQNFDC